MPGSLAILATNFQGEEQGRAFGVWAAASGIAPIIGPFVGGLLVDELSWRWIFIINVPLILVALWAAQRHIKESRDETASDDFDWIGALLVGLAVGGLSFGAIYGQQRQWQDPIAFVALARRGSGPDQPAVLLPSRTQSARAVVDVPLAQLLGHEPLDTADLWRAVRAAAVRSRCTCRARSATPPPRSAWR